MRDQEARRLLREFAARERGRGKPYPAALRERATRWARRQAEGGASLRAIATTLGVHSESVRRWLQGTTAAATLVPVEVVAGPAEAGTVVVVSPAGFRVEGLSVAAAAALLREVG
jgi:transposase-like protein